MYTILYPKNPHIRFLEQKSLQSAIKAKLALEINCLPGDKVTILDEDGYIVSTREISRFIIQKLG